MRRKGTGPHSWGTKLILEVKMLPFSNNGDFKCGICQGAPRWLLWLLFFCPVGVVTMRGILDADNKPILLCSYKDGRVDTVPISIIDLSCLQNSGLQIILSLKNELKQLQACDPLFYSVESSAT